MNTSMHACIYCMIIHYQWHLQVMRRRHTSFLLQSKDTVPLVVSRRVWIHNRQSASSLWCVCVKVQGGRGGTSAVKSCDYTLSIPEALTRFTCLLELRWYPGLQDRLSICHWSQMSPVKQLCIGPSQSQSLGAAAWPNFCCVCAQACMCCVCVCVCSVYLCVKSVEAGIFAVCSYMPSHHCWLSLFVIRREAINLRANCKPNTSTYISALSPNINCK